MELKCSAEFETHAMICLKVCAPDNPPLQAKTVAADQLPLHDMFSKTLEDSRFVVELQRYRFFGLLTSTSQSRAVLAARLCRYTFHQQNSVCAEWKLSIGVLLFGQDDFNGMDVMAVSSRMATKARLKDGSRIMLYNATAIRSY